MKQPRNKVIVLVLVVLGLYVSAAAVLIIGSYSAPTARRMTSQVAPGAAQRPTATPTQAPTPTPQAPPRQQATAVPTPVPAHAAYLGDARRAYHMLDSSMQEFGAHMKQIDLRDPLWAPGLTVIGLAVGTAHTTIQELPVPASGELAGLHATLQAAGTACANGVNLADRAAETLDLAMMEQAQPLIVECTRLRGEVGQLLP